MKKEELTKQFATRVRRFLDVERIRGYVFPENVTVGVAILEQGEQDEEDGDTAAASAACTARFRIGDVTQVSRLHEASLDNDIEAVTTSLVQVWLHLHATEVPRKHERSAFNDRPQA
jgi:hypothetical protein